jgi:hypothetical protein
MKRRHQQRADSAPAVERNDTQSLGRRPDHPVTVRKAGRRNQRRC